MVKFLTKKPIGINMAGRNSQVARILCLLDILDSVSDGLTVTDMWEKLTSRGHKEGKRTIYRDLDALSQAGFPLFPDSEDQSTQRWKLERNTRINQYFILSAKELFALFLARGALTPLQSTPFYEDLQGIFNKLEEKLGKKQIEYLNSMQSELKFEPGPQWGLGLNPDILDTIRAACAESQTVQCVYNSVNSKKESARKLGPHYLYYSKGGLYLVAEDFTDSKVKVFALPRIKEAVMLDETYVGSITTPEDFFNGSMGVYTGEKTEEITIDFECDVAQFVKERKWHVSQRTTNLTDGRIRITLELSQTPELCSWILGFGANAKVVSPTRLAEKVAVMAMETVKIYGNKVS
jgi:hypothetical protein